MHRMANWTGRGALWALFALWLAGCAAPQLRPGAALQPDAHTAIVVLSVTHSGQRGMDLLLHLDGPGAGLTSWLYMKAFSFTRDWPGAGGTDPTPADNPDGRLFVLALAPGEYRIDALFGQSETEGMHSDGYELQSEDLGVHFTAAAGRIAYVGNLHLAFPPAINYQANHMPATYTFELQDRAARDLERLRARHAGLQGGAVQTQLAGSPKAGAPLRYFVLNFKSGDGDFL